MTVLLINDNVGIEGQIFFNQPVRNNLRTYDSVKKIAIGKGDDYTTGCLLDHNHFKYCYKLKAIDLSKHKALDTDPKAMQEVNASGYLARAKSAAMFFIIK